MTRTRTYVELEISEKSFEEIKSKLQAANYLHAIRDRGRGKILLDMDGIALVDETYEAKKVASERLANAAKKWSEDAERIVKAIEDATGDHVLGLADDLREIRDKTWVMLQWSQLVWQEIWMFISLGKQVTNDDLYWISNRRGFDTPMRAYLKEMLIFVGLGELLESFDPERRPEPANDINHAETKA